MNLLNGQMSRERKMKPQRRKGRKDAAKHRIMKVEICSWIAE